MTQVILIVSKIRSEFAFNSNRVSNIYYLIIAMVLILYIAVSGTPANRSG